MMDTDEIETRVLSVRVTIPMVKIIRKYLQIDTHVSKSDFIRDALREKIKRDTPNLYSKLFLQKEVLTE